MGVGTGIEDDAVVGEAHLLHLVNHLSLDITLEVVYLNVVILLAQLCKIVVERAAAVDAWFANAQEVQVRTVKN